jgi:trigger factor
LYEAVGEAVERARRGGGPTFLECMTFRLEGHSFGATTEYVDADRLATARANEPVGRFQRWLVDSLGVSEETLAALDAEAVAAVDAAVDAATVEVPDDLVTARATERWERMERQLGQQGMDPNVFLQMQGKTRDELVEETKPDAERELKREAVVTAIAAAEGLEVSEEELVEALAHSAEHERTTPEKLLARLRENGRDAVIREDLLAQKAIELVADSATPIPLEEAEDRKGKAEATEKLLAPEGEEKPAGKLWTPGSD